MCARWSSKSVMLGSIPSGTYAATRLLSGPVTMKIQKLLNEGTSSPFIARLWLGVLELREPAITRLADARNRDETRRRFDRLYKAVLDALLAVRIAAREIGMQVSAHEGSVRSGRGRVVRGHLEVDETIQPQVSRLFGELLEKGYVGLKALQEPLAMLGLNVGFFFQNQGGFQTGLAALRGAGQDSFADYLTRVRREWSEAFLALRSDYTHKHWVLPEFRYGAAPDGSVRVTPPIVLGEPMTAYSRRGANRIVLFSEEVMVYAIARSLGSPFEVSEIPPGRRDPGCCNRFQLGIASSASGAWTPVYAETDDFV